MKGSRENVERDDRCVRRIRDTWRARFAKTMTFVSSIVLYP